MQEAIRTCEGMIAQRNELGDRWEYASEEPNETALRTWSPWIAEMLAPYAAASATYAWFDTLRAIEEFINLTTVDWDDKFLDQLMSLPVIGIAHVPNRLTEVRQRLLSRFGDNFCGRFTKLVLQGAAIGTSFEIHGFPDVTAGFRSVRTMMGYLQSRRRHFVGILHILPTACRGQQGVSPFDTLNVFLPIVEMAVVQMMGAQNSLIINLSRARLNLPKCELAELPMLDDLFLEPERAPITEISSTGKTAEIFNALEPLRPDRLFSGAELRNDILAFEAAYAEFNLAKTDFVKASTLVRRLSREFIDRDFWIVVNPSEFCALLDEIDLPILRAALVNSASDYMACLSTYAPMVLVEGVYRSTVTLLSRFIYHWRGRCLNNRKQFQIRAGFIFEEAVVREFAQQGFVVQDIVRINRREFDVVTIRQGVIWNVQCKNNFVDLESVEAAVALFRVLHRSWTAAVGERAIFSTQCVLRTLFIELRRYLDISVAPERYFRPMSEWPTIHSTVS